MVIGIDVTSALASDTGVGVCVRELTRATLSSSNGNDRFQLCAVSARRDSLRRLRSIFTSPEITFRIRRLPMRVAQPLTDLAPVLSVEALFGAVDLFHANHLLVPAPQHATNVMTVYDLTPIQFPEFHISSNRFSLRQLRRWVARVDRVIVNSRSTARDLEELARVDAARIRVVPLGVRSCFRPLPTETLDGEVLRRLGIAGDYILAVGSLEPRKNLERLLRAFHILKENYRIPHSLALVGPSGPMSSELTAAVATLKLGSAVRMTGFVDDQELNLLYNRASILVYPSLYEGFGLPPLEAMAAGCPVAVSNTSSIPEVVGDAGVYFDPTSPEEIAGAVHRTLDSPQLRSELVVAGRRRALEFTWQRAAEQTLAIYREARQERGLREGE